MQQVVVQRIVFNNAVKMLKYRQIQIAGKIPTVADFDAQIARSEYMVIAGSRAGGVLGSADVRLVIVAMGSRYSNKTADFKKMMRDVTVSITTSNEVMGNIIIVMADEPTSHLKKYLEEFRSENPNILVETVLYQIFHLEIPRHSQVPEHRVVSEEEVENKCDWFKMGRENVRRISCDDPMAIWIGARPGMWVHITGISENAGYMENYRICV